MQLYKKRLSINLILIYEQRIVTGSISTTSEVQLESYDGGLEPQPLPNVTSMEVKTKLSDPPCILGYSYGYDNRRIWVDEGCNANFTIQQCLPGKYFIR